MVVERSRPLSRVLAEYSRHYHGERNHQGKGNRLLFPTQNEELNLRGRSIESSSGSAVCSNTTGGLHE